MGSGDRAASLAFDESELADGDVLQRIRAGHPAAFGVLYRRHLLSARRLARSLVSSPADADDIVAEVFAATFAAIRRGSGPQTDFVPYLLRSVRRECQRTWRRTSPSRQTSLEEAGAEPPFPTTDDYARTDEAQVLHDAFAALPTRMRNVLWQVEVEGLSHDEIARRTHSTSQAVAQLVVRARRTLGERYLHAHLGGEPVTALPADCARTRAVLAEFVRGTTSPTVRHVVAGHLETCAACREAREHLELVNERLRGILVVALATTAAAPRPWVVGLLTRATNWVVGPTVPLTVATSLAVVGVVAPPAVFEPDPPEVEAAAPPPALPTAEPDAGGTVAGSDGDGFRADPGTTDAAVVDEALFQRPTPVTAAEEAAIAVAVAVPAAAMAAAVAVDPTVTDVSLPGPVTVVPGPDGLFVDPVAQVIDPDVAPLAPVLDVVEPVVAPVSDVLEPVVETVAEVVEPVIEIVEPVTDTVTDVVQPVTDGVQPVAETVAPAGDLVQPVTQAVEPVTDAVADVATPVTEVVTDVVEPVTDAVEPVADGLGLELPLLGG